MHKYIYARRLSQTGGTPTRVPEVRDSDGRLHASFGGGAESLATLDANSKVVEDPANATSTPGANKIVKAGSGGTIDDAWLTTGQAHDPGRKAQDLLVIAADIVEGEQVILDDGGAGEEVYEFEIVNTDSTDDAQGGDFDIVGPEIVVVNANYPNITFTAGALLRLEDEICRVRETDGVTSFITRGVAGTTVAPHADTTSIYVGDGVTPGAIAVGLVATLTPTAAAAALLAEVNDQTELDVSFVSVGTGLLLLVADEVGAVAFDVSTDLTGVGSGWSAAAMSGGRAAGMRKVSMQTRVVTAQEVAAALAVFAFDFVPVVISVLLTADGVPGAPKAWDGTVAVDGTNKLVTLTDGGAENFVEADVITLIVTD